LSINDDYSEFNDDNQDVQTVIDYVRQEFKNIFAKHKGLVIKLGKAIENTGQKEKNRICQEIKAILREEIALGLISGRAIERHCLDEWKKKTKPKNGENDNLSFSRQEQQAAPRVLVDASGNSIVSAATSDANPNNIAIDYESRPPDAESLNKDASPMDKDLEEEIKKSTPFTTADQQLSEPAAVVELKIENERLKSDLQSKSEEISSLHIRVEELEARPQNDQVDRSFDVQFRYLFDALQQHMTSLFKKHIRYVSFIAKVDPIAKRILNVQIHEENSESEQTI